MKRFLAVTLCVGFSLVVSALAFAVTGSVSTPTRTPASGAPTIWDEGDEVVYKFTAVVDGTEAVDETALVYIDGIIVGAEVQEETEGDITEDFALQLLDERGRDVLQGVFTSPEADDSMTDARHFRLPIETTSGGFIRVSSKVTGPVYLRVYNAGNTDEIQFFLRTKVR